MGGPDVALVLVQQEEVVDVLGEAHALENTHVLAAGDHECAVVGLVDLHHGLDHEGVGLGLLGAGRSDEVTAEVGMLADPLVGHHGDLFDVIHAEFLVQEALQTAGAGLILVHDVQAVMVRPARIDPVGRKAAAQAIAPVVHVGHRIADRPAWHTPAVRIDQADDAAGADVFLVGIRSFYEPGLFHLICPLSVVPCPWPVVRCWLSVVTSPKRHRGACILSILLVPSLTRWPRLRPGSS